MAKPPDESAVISVRIPQALLEQIDSRAEQERRPRGNLIRLLLERAMENYPTPGAEKAVRKTDSQKR